MNIHEKIGSIESRQDLADFVAELRTHLEVNASTWENVTLTSYLEAMQAWIRDHDGYYRQINASVPLEPSWKTMAQILYGAKIYE